MKKVLVLLLMLSYLLAACDSSEDTLHTSDEDTTTAPEQTTTEATTEETVTDAIEDTIQVKDSVRTVLPLPRTLSLEEIDDATLFVSLEEGGVTVDENGQAWMTVTVHTYDLYDMVAISTLQVGEVILIRGREIEITELTWGPRTVDINGGLDNGGFQLWTDEEGVYYEVSFSDAKSWQPLGEVKLPVAENFTFVDDSDPEIREAVFTLQDLLGEGKEVFYFFQPGNTAIIVENGVITCLYRWYTP